MKQCFLKLFLNYFQMLIGITFCEVFANAKNGRSLGKGPDVDRIGEDFGEFHGVGG